MALVFFIDKHQFKSKGEKRKEVPSIGSLYIAAEIEPVAIFQFSLIYSTISVQFYLHLLKFNITFSIELKCADASYLQ